MKRFVQKLAQAEVGPKIPVAAWWVWRTLGFAHPAAFTGRVSVGGRSASLEWRQAGELLQAMNIFARQQAWNRWQPTHDIRTVVDVGANIGQTVAYWKLRFPKARVGAVEMMPGNVERIHRQERLNGWKLGVLSVAATGAPGAVTIRLSDVNSRNRLDEIAATSAVRDRLRDETISVPGLPLAAVLDRLGFTGVDLMKIDIEGAEVKLLEDVANWAPRVHTLIIEIHDNVDQAWARRVLVAAGYRVGPLDAAGNPEWLCVRESRSVGEKFTG
jgi:FkbM family methyltransferase